MYILGFTASYWNKINQHKNNRLLMKISEWRTIEDNVGNKHLFKEHAFKLLKLLHF